MISAENVLTCIGKGPATPPQKVKVVAVITCDRPSSCKRVLETLLLQRHRFGRDYKLLVVDQSDGARNDVNALVDDASRRHRTPIAYVGRAALERFVDRLASHRPAPRETLSFVTSGAPLRESTYGAALNTALLYTAGMPVALFDDDIVPDVAVNRLSATAPFAFHADGDPTALRVYRRGADLARSIGLTSEDPIALHERLPGASLAYAVSRFAVGRSYVSPAAHKLLKRLPEPGRVAATALGIYGDCGLWSLHGYATREGPDLERLTTSSAYDVKTDGPSPEITDLRCPLFSDDLVH